MACLRVWSVRNFLTVLQSQAVPRFSMLLQPPSLSRIHARAHLVCVALPTLHSPTFDCTPSLKFHLQNMFRFILCSSLLVACPSLSRHRAGPGHHRRPRLVQLQCGAGSHWRLFHPRAGHRRVCVRRDQDQSGLFFVRLLVFWRFSVLCVAPDSRLVLTGFNF